MGGILAFQDLAPKASHSDSINVMTDLLITGLNRSGAFNLEPIHLYDTGSYYAITGFLTTVFIFALSFIYSFENESRYCIESAIENVSFF